MQANPHRPISADLLEVKRRMPRIVLEQRKSSVGELPCRCRQDPVTGPEIRRGMVGQSSVDRPAVCLRRTSSARPSSLPSITSASNCRSHASASNAENHSRNAASSSGWRSLTCPSICSTRLIKFSSTISAPANWPPGMLDGRRRAPSHPSLTAFRLQLALGLELQGGNEFGRVDGGLVFRAFVAAERPLVGFLCKDAESGLHCRIDTEFCDATD